MIHFYQHWKLYLTISLTVILTGLASIFMWGYAYSIDFVGGTNLEYRFSPVVEKASVQKRAEKIGVESPQIEWKSKEVVLIKSSVLNEKEEAAFRRDLESSLQTKITVIRTETVGPVIGAETLRKTAIAASLAVVGILLYIAFAFRSFNYAISAVIALVHDILVVAGTYSIISHFFGAELDILFVTAILTTMAFSVHDTIVVFDQMREYTKQFGAGQAEEHADRAVTTTMVRSLNNSFTIMFMLVALILLGGDTIRFFAVTLLIGTITGTYSSPFVSVPIAVWLEKRKEHNQQQTS